MCTRVMWPDAGGAVVVGRNMDFAKDLMTNLWKMPRGVQRSDGVSGKNTWTSKYGSVVAGVFDMLTCDGLNEKGLGAHVLWLAESTYGDPDDSRFQLSMAVWGQYMLDNFATVTEVVDFHRSENPQIVPMEDPTGGTHPAIHLAVNDPTGDSAIFEYIDGQLHVYHSKDYWVMTNSPSFDQQLELVKKVDVNGSDEALPGGCDAVSRFARASFFVHNQVPPAGQVEAISAMLSIMRNAAQPYRTPAPGKPDCSATLWQTVTDLTNRRYVFESTSRPNIVWVDLDDLDFSEGSGDAKLDLLGDTALQGGLAGEVSGEFAAAGPFHFVTIDEAKALAAQAEAAAPSS